MALKQAIGSPAVLTPAVVVEGVTSGPVIPYGFSERVGSPLVRRALTTLQVNLGKRCNQACTHCHVEAGPTRTENMDAHTADRLVELMRDAERLATVDLTGGAPELNPHFRRLVVEARSLGLEVIDRCNLTVLSVPGQEGTAAFLAAQRVKVVASLPCYGAANVDKQRGKGVFGQSIEGLRGLNALGYGHAGTGLVLDLVYNPGGAFLPPAQAALEADYRARLRADFGIVFSGLYTLTNMPIKRFRWTLERTGDLERYLQVLVDSYNPSTVDGLMCLELISVGWDGRLYDCDFNQMLEMRTGSGPTSIWEIDTLDAVRDQQISVGDHCFGCTAGAGSSCGGALTG